MRVNISAEPKQISHQSSTSTNTFTNNTTTRDNVFQSQPIVAFNKAIGTPTPLFDMSHTSSCLENPDARMARNISQPRETKTSLLRARMSAGTQHQDRPVTRKPVGHIHSTNTKAPSVVARRAVSEGSNALSLDTQKQMTESSYSALPGRHLPARMVAGTRRGDSARPGRRSGFRTYHSGDSTLRMNRSLPRSPAMPSLSTLVTQPTELIPFERVQSGPVNPAITRPSGLHEDTMLSETRAGFELADPKTKTTSEERPPVSIRNHPLLSHESDNDTTAGRGTLTAREYSQHRPRNHRQQEPRTSTTNSKSQDQNGLSPTGYTWKRLSDAPFDLGPNLLISPNANRIIMGEDESDKQHSSPLSLPEPGKDPATRLGDSRIPKSVGFQRHRALLKQGRPHSLSLAQSARTVSGLTATGRDVKARSVDAELLFPELKGKASPENHLSCDQLKPVVSEETVTGDEDRCLQGYSAQQNLKGKQSSSSKPVSPIPVNDHGASALTTVEALQTLRVSTSALQTNTNDIAEQNTTAPLGIDSKPGFLTLPTPAGRGESVVSTPTGSVIHYTGLGGAESESRQVIQPHSPAALAERNRVALYPPRGSSLTAVVDYTTPSPTSKSLFNMNPTLSASSISAQDVGGSENSTVGSTSSVTNVPARGSERSSLAKGIMSMSSLRGLFRNKDKNPEQQSKNSQQKTGINPAGSPISSGSGAETSAKRRRSLIPASPASAQVLGMTPDTGASHNDDTSRIDIADTMQLAMDIIDLARNEHNNAKKDRLLQMGKVMVDVITIARDAEHAMNQAMIEADKAEAAYKMAKKTVGDVAKLLGDLKDADN